MRDGALSGERISNGRDTRVVPGRKEVLVVLSCRRGTRSGRGCTNYTLRKFASGRGQGAGGVSSGES